MEHLTKHQLILLALLVSFVTSLATGIFTVSLMSQAPKGVTQTINQVVEKTIQVASEPSASFGTVAISVDDQVSNAVGSVSPSVAKIFSRDGNTFLGLGLIVTSHGLILTDRSILTSSNGYTSILTDGTHVTLTTSSDQPSNQALAFLMPDGSNSVNQTYTPISIGSTIKLGQTVLALSGTSTPVLSQSIVGQFYIPSSPSDPLFGKIVTSISPAKATTGGPLFTPSGDVIGIELSSLVSPEGVAFYPLVTLKSAIDALK
ncbi:MAG: trypsin-like peptidase domain-containing protein [Candidatus Taylorbacteria bacterium]